MEDVLTEQPPPSRFFQEDLDNFANPSLPLPNPLLLLNPSSDHLLRRSSLLVVAISAPSIAVLHRIPNKTLVGTLILPEVPLAGNSLEPSPRDKSCYIYSIDRPAAVLIAFQYPIPADRARAIAKSLFGGIPSERVLILDSICSQNFRGRLPADEELIFKLETSEERRSGQETLVPAVEFLPSGSVMDGLGAAMLGERQMRRAKGTLVATWPASGRTTVLPTISSLLRKLGFEHGGSDGDGELGTGFPASTFRNSDLYT